MEIQSQIPDIRPAVIIRLPNATLEINKGISKHIVQEYLHLAPFSDTLF